MKWFFRVCLLALLPALVPSAEGGILFNRKPKPNPVTRVPELVQTLKTESDERKRAAAATELRDYDPRAYPEIVPALVSSLNGDPGTNVRLEAAQSLSKLRPVSQPAGQALENAASNDSAMRVRIQARYYLTMYHMAGYSSRNPEPTTARGPTTSGPTLNAPSTVRSGPTTAEPPLAEPPSLVIPGQATDLTPAPAAGPVITDVPGRPSDHVGGTPTARPTVPVNEGPVLVPPQ